MINKRKFAVPFLMLSALMAACGPTPVILPAPQPEGLKAPAAPVVTADTDLTQAGAVAQRAGLQVQAILTQEALTPELYAALNALGLLDLFRSATANPAASAAPLANLSPARLGSRVLTSLGQAPRLTGLSTTTQDNALPTGTFTLDAQGTGYQSSALPADGLVVVDQARGTTLTAEWRVGGAATVWLSSPAYSDGQGNTVTVRQELPTAARLSVSRTGQDQKLAGATFGMTPGACLSVTGPEALNLDAWAGNAAQPELTAGVHYGWNDQGVSLKANARLNTLKGTVSADSSLAVKGATAHRCDLKMLSFTPTQADVQLAVSVPNDTLAFDLKARDLGNVVFSADALKVQNPFASVRGQLAASADHNGQRFFSAFGPLADGADLDLTPGDGVEVRYVAGGQLVTTNLQALLSGPVR